MKKKSKGGKKRFLSETYLFWLPDHWCFSVKYSVVVNSPDKTILAVNGDRYKEVRSLNYVNATKYGQVKHTFEKIPFINVKTIVKSCVLTHKITLL